MVLIAVSPLVAFAPLTVLVINAALGGVSAISALWRSPMHAWRLAAAAGVVILHFIVWIVLQSILALQERVFASPSELPDTLGLLGHWTTTAFFTVVYWAQRFGLLVSDRCIPGLLSGNTASCDISRWSTTPQNWALVSEASSITFPTAALGHTLSMILGAILSAWAVRVVATANSDAPVAVVRFFLFCCFVVVVVVVVCCFFLGGGYLLCYLLISG